MLTRRPPLLVLVAATLVVALAGFSRVVPWGETWAAAYGPGWHETAWPFLRDAFPAGRAWRKGDLTVYVRPKLGFCANCDTGVVDDSEVDQVTDVDLLDDRFVPVEDGYRIHVAGLAGRARLYNIATRDGTRTAEGIAVTSNCDLIVALVVGRVDDPAVARQAHDFIESDTVQAWLNKQLEAR